MPSKFWAAKVTGKRPFHGQVQGIFENQVSKFWMGSCSQTTPTKFVQCPWASKQLGSGRGWPWVRALPHKTHCRCCGVGVMWGGDFHTLLPRAGGRGCAWRLVCRLCREGGWTWQCRNGRAANSLVCHCTPSKEGTHWTASKAAWNEGGRPGMAWRACQCQICQPQNRGVVLKHICSLSAIASTCAPCPPCTGSSSSSSSTTPCLCLPWWALQKFVPSAFCLLHLCPDQVKASQRNFPARWAGHKSMHEEH